MKKLLSALLSALLSLAPILPAFPAQTPINTGTTANDHTGDTPYVYTRKINNNFADITGRLAQSQTVNCLGDSTCATATQNVPPGSPFYASSYGTGTGANSYLGWAMAASNNGIVADLVNSGYPGSPGGLLKVKPATTGACPPNSTLTVTPTTTPTGTPSNLPGSFTVPINASGQADTTTWIYLSNAGSGYTAQPAYSFSGSAGACTTNPTFNYALSGTGTWGVPGDTTDGALARVPDVCTSTGSRPTWVYLPIGTNSIAAGKSFASITSDIAGIVAGLQACGIRPILFGITPRNQGVSGWTATMDKLRVRINKWEQALSQQSALSGNPTIPYVDLDHFETDPSQSGATIGNPLSTITYDGLHPGPSGAFFGGMMLANVLRPYISPIIYQPNSQSDVYDATNNPGGNLIGTMGLMLGTTGSVGTNAGGTCAGSVATSWAVLYSGTGTVTCTSSIETARTDGLPGRRQVITYSNTGGGTSEKVSFGEFNNVASSLTLGTDKIYATGNLDVGNMQNIEYVGVQLLETASPVSQSSTGLNSGAVSATYPLPNSSQIALLQEAKILPDFGLSSAGSFKIPFRTPPIQTQTGGTNYSLTFTIQGTSASGATMSITAKISDVAIRKITP